MRAWIEVKIPTEGVVVLPYYTFKCFEIYSVIVDFFFKGLVAVGERAQKRSGNFSAAMKDLSGESTILHFLLSHPPLEFIICCHRCGDN